MNVVYEYHQSSRLCLYLLPLHFPRGFMDVSLASRDVPLTLSHFAYSIYDIHSSSSEILFAALYIILQYVQYVLL